MLHSGEGIGGLRHRLGGPGADRRAVAEADPIAATVLAALASRIGDFVADRYGADPKPMT